MDGWSGSDAYVKIGGDSMPPKRDTRRKLKMTLAFLVGTRGISLISRVMIQRSCLPCSIMILGMRTISVAHAGIPLECLPQDGSYRTFNLPLGTRISTRSAGEEVVFEDYERRLDVGFLKVSVARMMEPLETQNKI